MDITNENRNRNKWHLMLCELFYVGRHGRTEDSAPDIDGHYIVYNKYHPITGIVLYLTDEYLELNSDSEYDSDDSDTYSNTVRIEDEIEWLKEFYSNPANISRRYQPHPLIRNYRNIIAQPNYIKPEIGEYIILPSLEAIAILKTVWLRIIQRKWKKIVKLRREMVYQMGKDILQRQVKYKSYNIPGLRGMLYDLKTATRRLS